MKNLNNAAHYARKRGWKVTNEEYRWYAEHKPERCEICGREGRIYLDHNHATGKFRGYLCLPCNMHVGYLDKPGWAVAAMAYLKR